MTSRRILVWAGVGWLVGGIGFSQIVRAAAEQKFPINFDDAEWRRRLTPAQYDVLRQEGTEYAFKSPLLHELRQGVFACGQLEREGALPEITDLDVLLHPSLPEAYRNRIERLERALEGPEAAEARQFVRSMIDRVELTPRAECRGVGATLYGDLAAVLQASTGAASDEKTSAAGPAEGRLSVVAGARNLLDLLLIA